MSTTLISLLVGAHFRPPAKLLLGHLPSGARVTLEPEPDNPYDEHAVKVWISPDEIPATEHEALAAELPGFGMSLEELLATSRVHLGYVAASDGKPLAIGRERRAGLVGNREVAGAKEAKMEFGADVYLVVEGEEG